MTTTEFCKVCGQDAEEVTPICGVCGAGNLEQELVDKLPGKGAIK